MNFEQILDETVDLPGRRRRLTHVAIKRQFGLDDATVADVVEELIRGRQAARAEGADVVAMRTPFSAAAPPP